MWLGNKYVVTFYLAQLYPNQRVNTITLPYLTTSSALFIYKTRSCSLSFHLPTKSHSVCYLFSSSFSLLFRIYIWILLILLTFSTNFIPQPFPYESFSHGGKIGSSQLPVLSTQCTQIGSSQLPFLLFSLCFKCYLLICLN